MEGQGAARIRTIDAVRGFAVCGILVMNIVAMGMPPYAYVDPYYYGGTSPADLTAWGLAYVFADGKLRALFTILFGASMTLIADRAEGETPGPVATHYRRMAWLFGFGMIHAWLLWFGDILVIYAVTGAFAFIAWQWPPRALIFAAAIALLIALGLDVLQWYDLAALQAAALAPHAPDQARDAWDAITTAISPGDPAIAHMVTLYRGGFADVFAARAPTTMLYQTDVLTASLPETIGFMLLGILLYRSGFLSGGWSRRRYAVLIAIGFGIAVPLYIPIVSFLLATRFDPVTMPIADACSLVLRPWLALAYASAIILLVRSGRLRWLADRLAAAGRMAFSNYLGTTLITTTLFYGYGFGLYGTLSRAGLCVVVLGVWMIILLWSKPWLDRFAYGPLEWLWRSLARWKIQQFRRTSPIAT
jgi:uncharacterized protein